MTKTAAAVATLAASLFVILEARSQVPKELPDRLDSMPYSFDARYAVDSAGQVAMFEIDLQRFSVWDRNGARAKVCTLNDPLLTGSVGAMGFSGNKALLYFHGAEKFVVTDLSSCRVAGLTEEHDSVIYAVYPARDGWIAVGKDLDKGAFQFLRLDFKARKTGTIEPKGLEPTDEQADQTISIGSRKLPVGRRDALPVDVGGETWLLPRDRYAFIRPAQKGKDEYEFRPPDCMASKSRIASAEENAKFAERLDKGNPGRAKEVEATRQAMLANRGFTIISAVAAAATYRDQVAVMVRSPKGDRCRLDVWDVSTEALMGTAEIGPACPGLFSFTGDAVWVPKAAAFERINLAAMNAQIKKPCDALKKKVATRKDSSIRSQ